MISTYWKASHAMAQTRQLIHNDARYSECLTMSDSIHCVCSCCAYASVQPVFAEGCTRKTWSHWFQEMTDDSHPPLKSVPGLLITHTLVFLQRRTHHNLTGEWKIFVFSSIQVENYSSASERCYFIWLNIISFSSKGKRLDLDHK